MVQEIACNKACLDFGGKIETTPTGSFRVQIMINNKLESWHTALDRNGAYKQDQPYHLSRSTTIKFLVLFLLFYRTLKTLLKELTRN